MITASIVEAFLKFPTKAYLRSLGEVGTESVYATWVRAQNESYRNDGIKRLTEGPAPGESIIAWPSAINLKEANWGLATDFVASTQNLESSLHAVELIAPEGRGKLAQFIPIRFIFENNLAWTTSCSRHSMPWCYRSCGQTDPLWREDSDRSR